MEIVETSVFTKQIRRLLEDDEYRELQEKLVIHPLVGAVIRGVVVCGNCAGQWRGAARAVAYV